METIITDYKQRTWKVQAKLFKKHKPQRSSNKIRLRFSNTHNIHQSAPFSQTMVDVFLQGLSNSVLIFPRRLKIAQHFPVQTWPSLREGEAPENTVSPSRLGL